jgi:hypothetical protein
MLVVVRIGYERFMTALARVAERLVSSESPWRRVTMRVPAGAFGPGSRHQFTHYFEGPSTVPVSSIDDIVDWLQRCEYVRDIDQFSERDRWQHPETFERLRRGDCEDFALWTWRKLVEIGVEAEFFVGRVRGHADDQGPCERHHAWVVYRENGTEFLFEPAERNIHRMIRPLSAARHEYVPHFAVNRTFTTSAFVGVLDANKDEQS